jgi:tetratricopeptide (TPR) repeat protein
MAESMMRESLMQAQGLAASSGDEADRKQGHPPYEGRFASVMDLVQNKRVDEALASARAWRAEAPGDVLALVALGEAAEAKGLTELAERAYGSIFELFPNRADLRRFAGERLERLSAKDPAALDLAIDTFQKALADRPDHPSSHRLLTFALVRKKLYSRAFDEAVAAARVDYEPGRFAGVGRILSEDIGLVGAAWAKAEPRLRGDILRRIREAGGVVEDQPSVRFVLNWETDANDVDFHIHDARGGHAFFSQPELASGGQLYADVTTGYGPECFTIRKGKAERVGPYKLEAHYYSRGPMGYGMGKLEVIDHDGQGGLTFEERPFIVMVDQAFVDLGVVR